LPPSGIYGDAKLRSTSFERRLCRRNDLGGGRARAGREARSARRKGGGAPFEEV